MSSRPGGGGQGPVSYLEGWRAFNYANEIFGFNGWSSEILEVTVDFMDNDGGKYSCGIACTVRIHLKDGTFHDVSVEVSDMILSCRMSATAVRITKDRNAKL